MTSSDRPTRWVGVLFGLALASYAAYQQFKLPPVLPLLLERFHYDRVLAGGFMSVYALAGLLATLGVGRWIGRQGAYPALLFSLALMLIGNLVTLLAPGEGALVLVARAAEGLAFAVFAIVGPATANTSASQRHLPLVIGLTAAWIPLGQILAVAVAEPSLARGDWRPPWWLAIVLTLLFALWLWQGRRAGRLALAGGGSATAAPLTKPERLSLWIAGTAFLLFSGQYYAYMTWLPQYLVEVHGFGADEAMLGYLLPVVTLAIWNVIAGWLLRHGLDAAPMLVLGMAFQAACWFLLPVTGAGWEGLVSLFAYGIGAGLAPTALFAMPSRILGPGRPLVPAFAIIMTSRNVGVFFGPIVLAQLSKSAGGWDLSAPLFGVISALSLACGLWLFFRLRRG